MFKLNALSAAVLASAGTLSMSQAYAQENILLEEVVVEGIRGSLNKANDLKRNADVVQDSILAEDIGKFPDQNVAESLQRVTGVTISRAGGEGAQISVRSFGPEFNIVKLNHRTLATTTGGRSFDFQILPSELIGGADVIKSASADLSAGSIGAYVNVRSPRPLDDPGFNAVGAVKANYHGLSEEFSPEINGLISNTFADDTIGVLVGATYKESEGRIDLYRASHWQEYAGSGFGFPILNTVGEDGQPLVDSEGNPTNPDLPGSRGPGRSIWSMIDDSRQRTGFTAVVQWEPSSNFTNTLDLLYTKLEREALGSGIQAPLQHESKYTEVVVSDAGTMLEATVADTDLEMNVDYALSENTTSAMGLNSVFTQGALTLEFDVAYSKAESDWEGDNTTALHYTFFDDDGSVIPSEFHIDYSTDVPALTTSGGLDVTDPSKVRAAWQRYAASNVEDEIKELKLDALYEIDAGVARSVKAGIAYQDRTVAFDGYGTEFNAETGGATWSGDGMWIGDGSTWNPDSNLGVLPGSVLTLSDGNFMDGISGKFPRQWVELADHQAYREATQAYLETVRPDSSIVQAGWDTPYQDAAGSYENSEESFSAYAMMNFEGEVGDFYWSGNVGARYVDITNTAEGSAALIEELQLDEDASTLPDLVINTATTSRVPHSVETSEEHFLPSLNLKLELGGGHVVRTAASQTIARPNLRDAGVNYSESPGVNSPLITITGGNPELKSYEVTSFDLGYEFYADDESAYAATFFYKDITNFISTLTTVGPWDGPVEQALMDAYAENGDIVQYNSNRKHNRDGGVIQGLELSALYYFHGVMDGFGVQANYTYSDSEDKDADLIDQPLVPEPGSALEGFAKHSYNIIAFYDKDDFQTRVAYNWRDSFLGSRTGDGLQPSYTDEYGQLDASLSYNFTENLTASFEVVNLTNETRLAYLGQRDRVSLVEMTGRRFQAGLRATF
jgi:iron complex outermembrane receptor protein